jgi:hypothetical protein
VRRGGGTTRVTVKEILLGLLLVSHLSQRDTFIMVNMSEMCSFVFQEKSGSLPGQSYTSSKNVSRSDHSPVFGE